MRLQLIMKFVEMALHRRCTSVHFSMQHSRTLGGSSRAGVTPARISRPRVRAVGWSVSRWYQISYTIQVRRFIHLGDAHSKQWAALNTSSLWAYRVKALDNIHEVNLRLIYQCGL